MSKDKGKEFEVIKGIPLSKMESNAFLSSERVRTRAPEVITASVYTYKKKLEGQIADKTAELKKASAEFSSTFEKYKAALEQFRQTLANCAETGAASFASQYGCVPSAEVELYCNDFEGWHKDRELKHSVRIGWRAKGKSEKITMAGLVSIAFEPIKASHIPRKLVELLDACYDAKMAETVVRDELSLLVNGKGAKVAEFREKVSIGLTMQTFKNEVDGDKTVDFIEMLVDSQLAEDSANRKKITEGTED